MLKIPANQTVLKGGLFEIVLDGLCIYLKATSDTRSASYDTTCHVHDFDPYYHGFNGMNMPMCILIASIDRNNLHVSHYLNKHLK